MLFYYTISYYIVLYYTILYYTILYYTILYYTMLYYTILYSPENSRSESGGHQRGRWAALGEASHAPPLARSGGKVTIHIYIYACNRYTSRDKETNIWPLFVRRFACVYIYIYVCAYLFVNIYLHLHICSMYEYTCVSLYPYVSQMRIQL